MMKVEFDKRYTNDFDQFQELYRVSYNTNSSLAQAQIKAGWMLPGQYVDVIFEVDVTKVTITELESMLETTLDSWVKEHG